MRYSDFPRYSWLQSGAPAAPDYKISRFRRKLRSETLEYCVTYRIEFLFLKYWNLKSFVPLFGYSLFDYALNEVWGVMCEVESQMVNFIFWKYRIFFFIFLRNLKLFSHRINTLGLNAITKLNWKNEGKRRKEEDPINIIIVIFDTRCLLTSF